MTTQSPPPAGDAGFRAIGALVIGESLVDIVPRHDGTTSELPGGSPMNIAVGLARLGHDVRLATWIGRDDRGAVIADHVEECGVWLLPGSDGAERTPTATVTFDEAGSAHYAFDLAWRCPPITMHAAPQVTHVGSIGALLAPGAGDVAAAARHFHGDSLITYDPNIRPAAIPPHDESLALVEAVVAQADIVKVSQEDLAWLYPGRSSAVVAEDWLGRGPALVVVTRGDQGVRALARDFVVGAPAVPATVVDTIGAGDAFMAGLIDGLARRGLVGAAGRTALRAAAPETLAAILAWASRAAAICVSRPGADLPWRNELDEDAPAW
ncbi:MAG: carbohydrate kinase [Actinomycetia bacterium]|nr:carbohydrate kinase [Actinomycetes bacterium]